MVHPQHALVANLAVMGAGWLGRAADLALFEELVVQVVEDIVGDVLVRAARRVDERVVRVLR